jgi:hypothetical protein
MKENKKTSVGIVKILVKTEAGPLEIQGKSVAT